MSDECEHDLVGRVDRSGWMCYLCGKEMKTK